MGCAASSQSSGPEYGQYSTLGYNKQHITNNTSNNQQQTNNNPASVPKDEAIYGENIDFSEDKKRLEENKQQEGSGGNDENDQAAAAAALMLAQQREEERRREDEQRRLEDQKRIEEENRRRREEQENEEEEMRRRQEEEQAAALAAEAAKNAAEEEAQTRQKEEEEAQRKQQEEEEAQRKQQEEEEAQRKQQEEQRMQDEQIKAAAITISHSMTEDEWETPKPPEFGADYKKTDLNTWEVHMDFRDNPETYEYEERPAPNDGNLYHDYDFTIEKAVPAKCRDLEWKRPTEVRSNPILFSEGTTRFDVGQGSFGTCWFLSMVSVIADKPKLFKRVIPRDAYKAGNPDYDGVFHCRFWRFGIWDDVYVDDYLPIIYGDQFYGANSATDKNEMWPSLVEKGFARFYGNYDSIQGGLVQDAYINLTGGVAEMIDIDTLEKRMSREELFSRLSNALNSGAVACCDVPSKYDNTHGLVGGHAYSLTGALVANGTKLVRVRNPWGKTEWTGPWSDGSPEWQSIQGQIQAPNKDDGEFYMSYEHFLTYFATVTLCSITPDFDRDGQKDDGLNYTACLYGQWKGDEAAGFENKIKNPKFIFRVSDNAVDDKGKVPIVVQMIQRTKKRKENHPSIRCDLYKVLNDDTTQQLVLMAQGKDRGSYRSEMQVCFRFHVTPGEYCCVPSTIEAGIEKEFMIRVFTSGPVSNIRNVGNDLIIHELNDAPDLKQSHIKCLTGEWIAGSNAGGQVSNSSFHTNPQFHIDVPNNGGDTTVSFILTQEAVEPKYPLGFKLFKRDGATIPVDLNWLYENWDGGNVVRMTDNDDAVFIISQCTDELKYKLPPGEYLAIVHLDKTDQEKKFTLTAFSDQRIDVTGHQMS